MENLKLLKNNSPNKLDSFVALFIFIGLILFKYKFLNLPLFDDESYYARGGLLSDFEYIISYSFGHPVGWIVLNNIFYSLFDYDIFVTRVFSLVFNSFLTVVLFLRLKDFSGVKLSSACLALIITSEYYIFASGLSHPVIAMTFCGMIALTYLNENQYQKYAIWLTLSLLFRESALVFVFAVLVTRPNLKILLYSLPSVIILALHYVWNYVVDGTLLMHPYMSSVYAKKQSMFIYSFEHFSSYIDQYYLVLPNLILMIACILLVIFKKVNFRDSYLQQLFIVFFVHGCFFAFYKDGATRNSFLNLSAFYILTVYVLRKVLDGKNIVPFMLLISLSLFKANWNWIYFKELQDQKTFSENIKDLGKKILEIEKKNSDVIVVTTNPISHYFNLSYMGYVESSLNVISYGGIPGEEQIGSPDYIVVPEDWLENFASKNLREHVKKHHYDKIYEVKGQERTTAIYKKAH